ncbi:MAG: hypothetical protein IPK52_13490 [Chloroflexi bacterium]|nr:hypothetical protein [Chloroflexota bacterium]
MTTIFSYSLGIVFSLLIRSVLQLMRNGSAETFSQRLERDASGRRAGSEVRWARA